MNKRVILSVTNDLVTDQRLHRVCHTLLSMGFDPLLLGRIRKDSLPLPEFPFGTHRMKLCFEKGPLFYIEFNIRLFFYLAFKKARLLVANDLDTLLATYIIHKIRRIPLVYDSHEYFTEMPDLIGRKNVQSFWLRIERAVLPNIKKAYTVSEPIAEAYYKKYHLEFKVIRNLPLYREKVIEKKENTNSKTIIYQGALNMGRGIEDAIRAMKYLSDVTLIIAGDGYLKNKLDELIVEEKVENRVKMMGFVLPEALIKLTEGADLGLSLEEPLGANHEYALPNKLFDYIQARIPVLGAPLMCIQNIVHDYEIGEILQSREPKKMAAQIERMLKNREKRKEWHMNLEKAARKLNWEAEELKLMQIYEEYIG